MSELEDRFVKRGLWTDWSKGSIMGATLTVEAQDGILIVAFLTILASIGTAQLWNLFTFLVHQWLASSKLSDGLFWQHQVLLRTMPTPTAFMADSIKLSWVWRSKVPQSFLRSALLLAFALCFAIAAIAAGISTSYAVDNSNIEVLVDSSFCGRVNYTKVYEVRSTSTLLSSVSDTMKTYAMNCYQNTSSLPAPCRNTFTRPNITFSAVPAPCPWNATMCSGGDSPAISIDSGLLDMRAWFGLNVKEQDTVKLRKRTTCNVLPREGRFLRRNASYWQTRGFSDDKYTLNYGTYRNTPMELRPEATFLQNVELTENQPSFGTDGIHDYLLPDTSSIGINPLPEMQRDDADVAIIAVWLNDVSYEQPVEDPLFTAHRSFTYIVGGGYPNYTRFDPDFYAGAIGCAVQLTGSPLEVGANDYPNASPVQLSMLQLLRTMIRLVTITTGPLSGSLQAGNTVQRGFSPGLPTDQWIKEVIGWESLVWTGYQTILSASVIGPKVFDEYADEYRDIPTSAGDKNLCHALKMRKSGGFANVNIFALVFVTTFATIITLFNLSVLRFFIFLSRFRQALAPRIDRWVQDGIFQLQRRAFEAHDEGQWTDLEKEIPITRERELLGELPVASLPEGMQMELVGKEPLGESSQLDTNRHETKNREGSVGIQTLERMDSGLTLRDDCVGVRSIASVCK
ncbi:hypothetical protein K458DRAFT_312414 [Lentithecium fluviatile CBS 122367]|uniref:Uncharacterized protein n=1 Tax=Lentithecium fluviatile CBS 122367 TaxID=1168545 RepID=A0A6G1IQI8_9PLEO|nr:hypothetical protein K458DRAFT_312414 [Lentithecium fluviatile CBS 122367]